MHATSKVHRVIYVFSHVCGLKRIFSFNFFGMWLAVVLFLALVVLLLFLDSRKPKNYPPGPAWLPITGSAIEVHRVREKRGYLYAACNELVRKYDRTQSVLGLRVGKDRIVVVCGLEAVKEMLLNEDIDGRPKGIFYETRTWGERRGVIMTDEEVWKEQRRFIMKHLKEFGFGRTGMSDIVRAEAGQMLNDMNDKVNENNNGAELVQMHDFFNTYVLNTLWTMMAGIRYSPQDTELKTLQALLFELFASIDMVGTLFSHWPLLRFLAPEKSGYRSFINIHSRIWTFLRAELEKHKREYDNERIDRDFMDVYIRMLHSSSKKDSYSESQLVAICMDMFMAGTETTSKSLGFGFLYLVRDQNVQKKAQEEIDDVIGRDRLPTLDDRINMPYNEAIVLESIRHFMGRTFGIPHRALRHTQLAGFFVPKDTMVIPNFNDILMNEEHFSEPYSFRPERFISCDNKVQIPEKYFPFGIGKHRCMGEVLARSNIFMFTVTMLQNFTFEVPPGEPLPSTNGIDGATPSAAPFRALVTPRPKIM